MPYHIFFSTTLLLYKLDTLLLKQKNLSVLDITGFFFRIRTQVTTLVLRTSTFTWVLMRKKKPVISNTGRFFCVNSTVSYTNYCLCIPVIYLHEYIFGVGYFVFVCIVVCISVNLLHPSYRFTGMYIHMWVLCANFINNKIYFRFKFIFRLNHHISETKYNMAWGKEPVTIQ